MIIGFTGTRNGMTDAQRATVRRILMEYVAAADSHNVPFGMHGDCVGADADFDAICRALGVRTYCRPCTFGSLRAHTGAEEYAPPTSPMKRNREIVADASVMIACPPNDTPIKKGSGTWATIGFTRKKHGTSLHIVYPDGRERHEDPLLLPTETAPEGSDQTNRKI